MKTFNEGFASEMGAPVARPRTLAVFHLATGDVHVSDVPAAPDGGPVFLPLVVSWGELSAPVRTRFGFRMPETSVRISNSGVPAFTELLESCVPEETEVELYQWFDGLPWSDREPLGRFVISSPVSYDEDHVELGLVCSMVRRNRTVGRTISRDGYPGADPDSVGRTAGIVYGRVDGLRCHAVDAGAATTLGADLDGVQTTGVILSLAPDEAAFPASGTLQVGREKISYTGISGKTLTGVVRGVSGTSPAPHSKGDTAFEVRQSYEYLVADHPVKSIGDVYVGGVRVMAGVTRLTDTGGAAKLVFDEKFSLEKSVELSVDEGNHEHGGILWSGGGTKTGAARWTASQNPGWATGEHVGRAFRDSAGNYFYIKASGQNYIDVASIHGSALAAGTYTGEIIRTQVEPLYQDTISSYFNAPSSGDPASLCDKGWSSYCSIQVTSGYIKTTRSAAVNDKGIIVGAKLCGTYGNSGASTGVGARSEFDSGPFAGQYVSGGGSSVQTVRTADTLTMGSACTWQDFSGSVLKAKYTGSSNAGAFWEHWVEVYYIPYSGGSSPATGVSLKGDSTADFVVGGRVTCDLEGYADDAQGTYTGMPGELIENPADVVRHFMANFIEVPESEFDASFDAARETLKVAFSGGFTLAGVIDEPVDGLGLVEALCSQCGLTVFHDGFTARASLPCGSSPSPDRVLSPSMVKEGSLKVVRTGREEVVNRLAVRYKKDLSSDGTARFLEVADSTGAYPSAGEPASVATYGPRGPARPLAFSFVREQAAASYMRDFLISRYKDAVRRISLTLFMDSLDLEPGDVVGLGWNPDGMSFTGTVFEIEDVSFRPGSLPAARPDEMAVRAREVI